MKIFLIGDIGSYNNITKKIFKNINNIQKKDDILIILGDNFYPDGIKSLDDKSWKNYINLDNKLKTYCILGNHDYLGNVQHQINCKLHNWDMEGHYYKKTIDNYDIFFFRH